MNLKLSDEEIWFWYQSLCEQRDSGENGGIYCTKNNLDYKKFSNMRYRIFYIQNTRPQEYAKFMEYGKLFLDYPGNIKSFCKEMNVNQLKLGEMNTHIAYISAIDRTRKKKESNSEEPEMRFVALKPAEVRQPLIRFNPLEADVIESKNDIELVITKGVKVIISPSIDSSKIIKIIELLKDL